jgi:hypothetical protein
MAAQLISRPWMSRARGGLKCPGWRRTTNSIGFYRKPVPLIEYENSIGKIRGRRSADFQFATFRPAPSPHFVKVLLKKCSFVHKVVHVRLKFLDPMQKNYTQCKLYMSGFPGITSPHDILSLVHKFLFVRLTFLAVKCKIFA